MLSSPDCVHRVDQQGMGIFPKMRSYSTWHRTVWVWFIGIRLVVCIRIYVHMFIHNMIYIYTYVCMCVCACVCIYIYVSHNIYIYIIYIYLYIIYIYTHVYIYIYISTYIIWYTIPWRTAHFSTKQLSDTGWGYPPPKDGWVARSPRCTADVSGLTS